MNDGHAIEGYRTADGVGWITVSGVAAYRFAAEGPVEAASLGGDVEAIEDTWLRSVLPLVVQARGTQVLHASAVYGSAGVVALCGVSTAGKSTVCAALARTGIAAVADDALGFEVDGGKATALTLPFALRLRSASASYLDLPFVAARGVGGETLALRAIVILEPNDDLPSSPSLLAVSPAKGVGALMPHAYCFSLDAGKEELVRSYAALAAAIPISRLRFQRHLGTLDAMVERVRHVLDG